MDAKNVFVRPGTVNELAAGIAPVTQFGRMCAKLRIPTALSKLRKAVGELRQGKRSDPVVKIEPA